MLSLKNVRYAYPKGEKPIINHLSFTIEQGEWVAIIGPNGSGKSTIAQLLSGLLLPQSGVVSIAGLNPHREEDRWQIRRTVGMVFQNPENQLVGTTVLDDVAFGLENLGVPPVQMSHRIEAALRRVGLWERRHREPHQLSGGEKQRLAIASVLAMKPKAILFDEATSMLDPTGRKEIRQLMHSLHQEGLTVVTITHDMDEALLAQRVLLVVDGQLVADGAAEEILTQARLLRTHRLEPPFVVAVREELRQAGIPLPENIYREEALIEALWRLSREN